jgi:hypothetical protein
MNPDIKRNCKIWRHPGELAAWEIFLRISSDKTIAIRGIENHLSVIWKSCSGFYSPYLGQA